MLEKATLLLLIGFAASIDGSLIPHTNIEIGPCPHFRDVVILDESVIDSPQISISFSVLDGSITFDVVANGTGYVGIGFSNSSGMSNADIFMGGVDNGEPYSGDYTSRQPGSTPTPDQEQNWFLDSATEENGQTILKITRQLDTGDVADVQIENKTIAFIWALGMTDALIHHGVANRGQIMYNFLINVPEPTEPPTTTEATTTLASTTTSAPPVNGIIIDNSLMFMSYTISGGQIALDILSKGNGYVGLGFSNSSGMTNSDIFIGGVMNDGESYYGDYTSRAPGMPTLDMEQNWELNFAAEVSGLTQLKVSRMLNTGDLNDVIIENKVMTIIWAVGNTDNLEHHDISSRGQILYNLMTGTPAPADFEI